MGAAATTGITTSGSVQFAYISNPGAGYTANVNIIFPYPGIPRYDETDYSYDNNEETYDMSVPVGFVTATAIGRVNNVGVVTSICITNAGSGYTMAPTAVVDPPPGIGSQFGGSYVFNEVVTGSQSGTTARVKEYDAVANTLEISIVTGEFSPGETIIGSESGAKYAMKFQNTDDLVTPYADNDVIETEADKIIDFSTSNPFGMP